MKQKRVIGVIFTIGILLICLTGYFYYQNDTQNNKTGKTSAKATTEKEKVKDTENVDTANITTEQTTEESQSKKDDTSQKNFSTTESKKNQKLPKNYVWDYEKWGEPPQIIYDFAENQIRFDYIVNEVDSIISEKDGYVANTHGGTIYYADGSEEDMKDIEDGKFIKNVRYILNKTKFYDMVKEESGYWVMEYNQEEYRDRYIYTMTYITDKTEEEAYEYGYIRVVGNWYFGTIWKI